MSRLPHTLNHAIDDLIYIATFHPYILDTRLVMSSCHNGLLNDHRRRCNDNRRRRYNRRLGHNNG
jgi:hypothetical protein